MQQPVLVMFALGIACALRADYGGRVIVVLGTVHAPDGALVDKFDFQRAGRGAVVRAGRIADPLSSAETGGLIHAPVHYRDDCCHREGVDSETNGSSAARNLRLRFPSPNWRRSSGATYHSSGRERLG